MLNYILILIFVIFSAFFSASEIAYASANELRIKKAAENGGLPARWALYVKNNYDDALIGILIGNNIVNIFSSSIATVIAVELTGSDNGAWIATFIITLIILTFGEILPKIFASRKSREFTAVASIPLRIIMTVLYPFIRLFGKTIDLVSKIWETSAADDDAITEDDLETIIDTVEDEGVVDGETADLLQGALDFGDLKAYEILTPRVDMFAIDADDPPEVQKQELLNTIYTRVPVYKDTVDNIIGIINMNTWLMNAVEDGSTDIEKSMTEPLFVHETMLISDVFEHMRAEKKHIAIVTDEYGGVAGLLTMEEILEQIVGEIWDEADPVEPEFIFIGDGRYLVNGDMRILELFDELDVDDRDFEDNNATVGGFAVEMLNDYADVGDTFDYKNLTFTVTKAEEHRVTELEVIYNSASGSVSEN